MKFTATDKTAKKKTKSKNIKTRVIPGYHLSLGIVVTMLSVIVLIPLASVLVYSLKISPSDFAALIMKENVRNAFITSITSSFIAAIINVVFGLIVAWTLVKYDFPGKWLLDGLIELPFALPTAVAGITLSKLYSGTGFFGKGLSKLGIDVAYTQAGIVVALVFVKTSLMPGESKRVTVSLDDKAFRYWNVKTNSWEQEGGVYKISVGSSSEDIVLSDEISLKGTTDKKPYDMSKLSHYESGDVQNVGKDEFAKLMGHEIPDGKPDISRNMTLGEMNHARSPLGWLIWAILTGMLNRSLKKGSPDLNLLFQLNMPLRGLAKMTSGMISMGMVDGIVLELKGFWFVGIIKVLVEFIKNIIQNRRLEKRLYNYK